MIIQCGKATTGNATTRTINLPTAYKKVCYIMVTKGDNAHGSNNQAWASVENITLTSFKSTTYDTYVIYYLSIGI